MKHRYLDIAVDDKRWNKIPRLAVQLEKAAQTSFAYLPPKFRLCAKVTVLLTNDASIRKLNRDFRGIDKPTNVLSFPQFEPSELSKKGHGKEPVHLGDIAIASQYVVDEAINTNKILKNHLIHLVIHGLLHLFGYDHYTNKDAIRMEGLEKKLMAALGLPDPYLAMQQMEPKRAKTSGKKRRAAVKPKR